MAAPHYTPTGAPVSGAKGQSSVMRSEFTAIETGIQAMNSLPLVVTFDDLNTAKSRFVTAPWDGKIVAAYAVNDVANTTTATVLTLELGGTAVTMPTWQFGATDAIGTVASSVPTALNTFSAGDAIEVITDGGGTPTMPGSVTLVIERT
jgi:hypothetical protein